MLLAARVEVALPTPVMLMWVTPWDAPLLPARSAVCRGLLHRSSSRIRRPTAGGH